ncbi:hypothetical protein EV421DRAFT_1838257 [Armillaria borealis]|uniref:Uncharacterized protein n=1 Tax=Armillaria borealis TaxID=47425 RepID=A0AA39J461_9AGAR|nr:hypothetical protein EV421DRAFT_1838257 [Armillaria borealis]
MSLPITRIVLRNHGKFWTIFRTTISLLPMSTRSAFPTAPSMIHTRSAPCPFLPPILMLSLSFLTTRTSCQPLGHLFSPPVPAMHSTLPAVWRTFPSLRHPSLLLPVAPHLLFNRISLRPKLIARTNISFNTPTVS